MCHLLSWRAGGLKPSLRYERGLYSCLLHNTFANSDLRDSCCNKLYLAINCRNIKRLLAKKKVAVLL